MNNETDYYLILADLRQSTALAPADASAVMTLLKDVLAAQSSALTSDLLAPLEINYGDEFAGLFRAAAPIHTLIQETRRALYGRGTFRFVVAYGRIGYAGGTVREMGGPVFEVANNSLQALKKRKQFARWELGVLATDDALSALYNAADTLLVDMTPYQYQIYNYNEQGLAGVEIAALLGKDPRSVSEAKRAGKADLVSELNVAIKGLLAAHDARP